MNDWELNELLTRARIPEREAGLWEALPKRVLARVRGQPAPRAFGEAASPRFARLAWAWGAAIVALLAVLIVFYPRETGRRERLSDARPVERCFFEVESLFPNRVRALVFDDGGARLILAEEADVPSLQPVYLRVCGPNGCQEIVTFSGQQIRLNGDWCEVLLTASGQVVLMGEHLVWPGASSAAGTYRVVEARALRVSS